MSILISVIQGSILEVETDVIVNAANSHGIMGGGVAGVIKRVAGQGVEDEAKQQAPIVVGAAALPREERRDSNQSFMPRRWLSRPCEFLR